MPNFLCITVRYLSPTYEGYEWPPSPAKLFQALIAGAKLGERQKSWKRSEEELRWLQTLGPPIIVYSQGTRGERYTSYGPLNQMDLLISLKSKQPSVSATDFPPFGIPPSLIALPSKGKPGWAEYMDGIPHGPWVLLDDQPTVHYLWRVDGTEDLARRLCKLAEWIVALGRGTDLAIGEGKIIEEEEVAKLSGARLTPTEEPRGARYSYHIPKEGFLELVLERFEKKRFSETHQAAPEVYSGRVTRQVFYRDLGESWGPMRWYLPFVLLHPEEERLLALGTHRWTEVVAWSRHALAKALEGVKGRDWISEFIQGHGGNGTHVCFVPVPSLPHDGLIRRMMIVGHQLEVYEILRKNIKGTIPLIEEAERNVVARLRVLEPREDRYFEKFTSKGERWITASPLILHGHDYRRGKYSPEKTQGLILQAFHESGYNVEKIKKVWFQKSPLFPGTRHVLEYRTSAHLKEWPRYHVGVEFEGSVLGPVIAGIGQHYGFGLFIIQGAGETGE
jgi:CRISPR-associated protein Csb2